MIWRIIIWGTGNTAREALKYVSDNVEIIGFLDNNVAIREFAGLKALSIEKIEEYDYDFIVICSIYYKEICQQISNRVEKEKILINPTPKTMRYWIYKMNPFETKWNKLLTQEKNEIFISGISYQNDGINQDIFLSDKGKRAFNFALRGQDLFYDFQIAMLLGEKGFLENTTHYIIGLCYYSFELDLSKTNNGWEIIRYYPYIKEPHNLMKSDLYDEFVWHMKKEIKDDEIYYRLFAKRPPYVIDLEEGEKTAKVDFNKNYPIAVWENKKILNQFIDFLEVRNIKPIIVIMPAVEGYVKGTPKGTKQKFYDNLKESIGTRKVQILDYFGSYYGEIADYYHVSHFNKKGAEKFTKRLVQDIEW